MIYFREFDGKKEKYEISFDKDALRELMKKIAINCGEKSYVKKECKKGSIPSGKYFDNILDKNYLFYTDISYTLSPNKGSEWDHYIEYEVDLYYCNYYQHICPELVSFIDDISDEKENAIDRIFNNDFSEFNSFLKVKDKIKLIQQEIANHSSNYILERNRVLNNLNKADSKSNNEDDLEKSINDLSLWMKTVEEGLLTMDKDYLEKHKELKDKLDYYLSIEDLNKNQEDVSKYIKKLQNLINIQLVDTISLDEINRVKEFLSEKVTNNKQLVRKLS